MRLSLLLSAAALLAVPMNGCAGGSAPPTAVSQPAQPAAPDAPADERFRVLYGAYEAKLSELSAAHGHAWWAAANHGRKEDFERAAALELEIKQLQSDAAVYKQLEALRTAGVGDPVLSRTLDVMYLEFKGNQIPAELREVLVKEASALEQAFNTFRAEVDGKARTANEIRKVLAESDDSGLRQRYWEASKAIGPQIAERLRALVRKRNEAARALGFGDYYEMQLVLSEQQPGEVAAIFDEVDTITAQPFAVTKAELDGRLAKRFGVAVSALKPWHYSDTFFQESPGVEGLDLDAAFSKLDPVKVCTGFFEGIGLPVVGSILERSDLYEREGKVEHAFCAHLDRKGDVRVLCNLKSDERWTGTLLHELGHGVYDAHIDAKLPFLLRSPAHSFTTEGVAELFGTLTRDSAWLAKHTALPPETRERLTGLAQQESRLDKLIFARWSLVMVHFERALYADPEQDLQALWWKLVKRFQGLEPPESMEGRADWATKIHVVIVPAYYHNYLLGRMFAAQLRSRLAEVVPAAVQGGQLSMSGHPEVGRFLQEQVFAPGLRYRWDDLVKRATGAPLGAKAFASTLR